jgi:hypothetical protein
VTLAPDRCHVVDRVSGAGRHRIGLTWQFAPGLRVERQGERRFGVVSPDGLAATVDIAGPSMSIRILEQTDRPGPGAVSPSYNVLRAAPALRVECDEAPLPIEIATTITL